MFKRALYLSRGAQLNAVLPRVLRIVPVANSSGVFSQLRRYNVLTQADAKVYKYQDMKALVQKKDPNTVIVDVREPMEFVEGHIPGAVNVPFKTSPGALDLSPEEFEENFGFSKPEKTKELVFYCLGGVRSSAAEQLANTFGYEKRGNYIGSWEDWVANENKAAPSPQ